MAEWTTVRVSKETLAALKESAEAQGVPVARLVESAAKLSPWTERSCDIVLEYSRESGMPLAEAGEHLLKLGYLEAQRAAATDDEEYEPVTVGRPTIAPPAAPPAVPGCLACERGAPRHDTPHTCR